MDMDRSSAKVEIEREFGEFVIDAHTPDTISMPRLADYMTVLSKLLGKGDSVHFERIEEGSLKIRYWTPKDELPDVIERPTRLMRGEPDPATLAAYNLMNDLLEADRATGTLEFSAVVIPFPGRERPHSPEYGPFDEELAVEGQLVSIGGKGKQISAQIRDGANFFKCQMSRRLAMEMCHYLFGPIIRVSGRAKWLRDRNGEWILQSYQADAFEELDDTKLSQIVLELREAEGDGWRDVDDPLAELSRLRDGS